MDNQDGDYQLARTLQEKFDEELLEISSEDDDDVRIIDTVQRDHQLALKLQSKYETEAIELAADSDDDVIFQAAETVPSNSQKDEKPRVHSISTDTKHSLPDADVKLFRAEPVDLNSKEYFIEELLMYVDPEYNFEWKFIDVLPDVQAIFGKFDELFFQSRFKAKKFNIMWSGAMGSICTNRNFNDDEGRYTIALNAPLLTLRPRIEVISIILHEMIHAFLKLERVEEHNNGHGVNFRKMMIYLNRMLQTSITFNHKLNDTSLVCRTQWYRCTGICHNYKPFHGIVRSTEGPPGLHSEWWKQHSDSCGGTFYKIYEMGKKMGGEVSTRYAVNVRYMLPKRENIRGRIKTNLPPKESVDLTSDVPIVIASASREIISVDTEDSTGTNTSSFVADKFVAHFSSTIAFTRDAYEMQCPICQERIKRKLFSNHIDGCKGFVRHVSWKRSANSQIVQNGLLELKANPRLHTTTDGQTSRPISASSSASASYQQVKRKRFG